MSLPVFSTQAQLFSTAGLSASLFTPTDRYRLLAKLVYPKLVSARGTLEKCYCADNGRVALEPVLMLGVSILQELDGVPDRLPSLWHWLEAFEHFCVGLALKANSVVLYPESSGVA
jgi:hypothetical protein